MPSQTIIFKFFAWLWPSSAKWPTILKRESFSFSLSFCMIMESRGTVGDGETHTEIERLLLAYFEKDFLSEKDVLFSQRLVSIFCLDRRVPQRLRVIDALKPCWAGQSTNGKMHPGQFRIENKHFRCIFSYSDKEAERRKARGRSFYGFFYGRR